MKVSASYVTETAPNYLFDKVQKGNLEITVSSAGQLAAISTVKVGIQVSGTINKVLVDFNDVVKKGQVLALLDTTLLETDVEQAAANVEKAEAEVYSAQTEYDRNLRLRKQGVVTDRDLQQSETVLKTSRAILHQVKASLKKARTNLENAVIKAPINGTIIEKSIDAGQTVAASFSTPTLFTIAEDLSHMQIEAMVDETDIGQIKDKQHVRFTVQAYPDNTFSGIVRQIRLNSQVISNVVNYTVVINAENKEGLLLPGMTATVDFIIGFQSNALLIPSGALAFTPTDPLLLAIKQEGDQKPAMGDSIKNVHFYYLDQAGQPKMAVTTKGLSNGLVTAITPTSEIYQEMPVIIGYAKTASSNKSSSLLGRLMSRPGRLPR
ncbi:efflux RND transporter periplasmic adaptor subunit, partial [bacterium]|nr:efflux RND transporter periplasmic adaptor subunit [bacterium]